MQIYYIKLKEKEKIISSSYVNFDNWMMRDKMKVNTKIYFHFIDGHNIKIL